MEDVYKTGVETRVTHFLSMIHYFNQVFSHRSAGGQGIGDVGLHETLLEKQRGVLASVRDDVNYFCNIPSLYLKGAIEGTPPFLRI